MTVPAALVPGPAEFAPGQILVKPRAGLTGAEFTSLIHSHGATEQFAISQINVHVLSVPEGEAEALLEAFQQNPDIEFAERDYLAHPAYVPDDPYLVSGAEWHIPKIQAPQAWDLTEASSNVVVAIIDSGVSFSHPDLAGKLLPGYDFVSNDNNPSDTHGHGTAVTGTVAAVGNNGIGVAGVAHGCLILPVKVLSPSVAATHSRTAQAITYATAQGARVINISLAGSGTTATLRDSVNYAWSNNVVVVACAGNNANNVPQYPAAYTNVLGVSATETNDTRAGFSSYGSYVSLSAPGNKIWTTTKDLASPYSPWWGTSFASPIVAGVAALVASANPSLSNTQIVTLLKLNADDLGATGYDMYFGYGRVNALRAVTASTNAVPVIIAQPSGLSVAEGDTAVFAVTATGATPRAYQWKFNGTSLGGATAASLTNHSVQFSNAGNYTVVVSNVYGVATSLPAALDVTPVPPVILQPILVDNDQVTITWSAISGRKYRLQYISSAVNSNWTSLTPDVIASGPTAFQTDQPDGAARRFYRVVLIP